MRRTLIRHPDSPCAAVSRIEVEVARPRTGVLALRYLVVARTGDLHLPPPTAPIRTDELWRRTCFEAFLREPQGEAYREVNLAPSTQWAAYGFDGYRKGMRPADGFDAPHIRLRMTADGFELHAAMELAAAPCRLGLSAVIEEADGRISYWALAHPPGKPDFHHADCFALELPAPEGS
jgi:hypothetical protein